MHDARRRGRVWVRRVAVGGCVAAAVIGGCASYANVPEPESSPSVTSPNARQPRAAMTAALQRVLRQYPPGRGTNAFAVNLPPQVSPVNADELIARLGPGAELASPGNRDLPTYHVGRIWIRGAQAKVDVFRPVVELGRGADGVYEQQAITVWLQGGIGPWHTVRTQKWAVGAFPRPEVFEPEIYEGAEPETPAQTPAPAEPAAEPTPQPSPTPDAPPGVRIEPAASGAAATPPAPERQAAPDEAPAAEPPNSWVQEPEPARGPELRSGDESWFSVEPIGEGG